MPLYHLTDREIAHRLAAAMRAWRISPAGAGLTQEALARKSGVGLTPLKRFEKTGGATLGNFIAMMRALGLLDRLENLIPDISTPSPMELLEAERRKKHRKRAPRTKQGV